MSHHSHDEPPTEVPNRRPGSRRRGSGRGKGARRKRGGTFKWLKRLFCAGAVLGVCAVLGAGVYYMIRSLDYDLDEVKQAPERTLVFDREGNPLGHVSGHGENRVAVPVDQVSPHFVKALLAREDSRFYSHGGVDYRGVIRAMLTNVKSGGMEQGASTLTMQLARNVFEQRQMTLDRKLLEVALAYRLELKYSKDEILSYYMNRVYFGSGLYGVERAAQGYFMKSAADLSLGESAMLAGVIRGPSLLNPFTNLDDAKATRDEVLARLVADGAITKEEETAAKNEVIALRPPDQRLATGSYVTQMVYDLLNSVLTPQEIERGGFKIYTTIDATLQAAAEKALDAHLSKIENQSGYRHPKKSAHKKGGPTQYLQGAVMSMDNATGGILAIVGGRSYADSAYNRAYMARRQVGSTFKPFVYAAALDKAGLLPGTYISDNAVRIPTEGGRDWTPKNSDGTFTRWQPAAVGLIRSRNTMTVRVGQIVGAETLQSLGEALKIGKLPASLVSTLGAFESTPYAVTSAFATFPAKGVNLTPFVIDRIVAADGKELWKTPIGGPRIFPESVAWVTSDMMGKVMDEGTGVSARRDGFQAPAYGKTGTTNDFRDAWFVGFTDKITTGVWVGFDQPKTISSSGYGGTLSLPIWTSVMKTAETTSWKAAPIPAPSNTRDVDLCRDCGLLASNRSVNYYGMDLPDDLNPGRTCRGHAGNGLLSMDPDQPLGGFPMGQEGFGEPPPAEEGTVGRTLRGIGRLLFGDKRRRE